MSESAEDGQRAVELYKRACEWLETDSKEQFGLEVKKRRRRMKKR